MRTILLSVLDPLRRVIEGRLVGSRGIYLLGFIGILQEGLILLILQMLVLQLELVVLRLESPKEEEGGAG